MNDESDVDDLVEQVEEAQEHEYGPAEAANKEETTVKKPAARKKAKKN